GHPDVVAIAARQRLPEMHDAILEVRVLPEERPMRRVVAVPALVLAAGQGVEIDDGVEPVPPAALDRPIEEPESGLLQLEGTSVVLEVTVAHGQPHDVESQRGDEGGVLVAEEHVQEAIDKTKA